MAFDLTDPTVAVGINDFWSTHPLLQDLILNPVEATEVTANSSTPISFICPEGHVWVSAPKFVIKGRSCPACSNDFKFHRDFGKMLKSIYSGEIVVNGRLLKRENGRALKLDFFLPELSIAYEIIEDANSDQYKENQPATGIWSVRGNGIKRGPKYHAEKDRLALEQLGVKITRIREFPERDKTPEQYMLLKANTRIHLRLAEEEKLQQAEPVAQVRLRPVERLTTNSLSDRFSKSFRGVFSPKPKSKSSIDA